MEKQLQPSFPSSLCASFLSFLDVRPKTLETYTRALRPFFSYLQQQNISQPARRHILAYRDSLRATHKPATVQSYLSAVRLFFRWTHSEGHYPNIAEHVKCPSIGKEHKKDHLTPEQVRAVLTSIDRETPRGLRDYALLSLMVCAGLRAIEVVRADADDLRALGNHTVLYIQGKGREEKTDYVKVPAPVEEALRAYLRARGACGENQPLFVGLSNNHGGERMTTRAVSGIVKARLADAGFCSDRLTAHSLRHTAVTLSLLGGATLQQAQQFARHANMSTTLVYAHNLERMENPCEQVVANAIFQDVRTEQQVHHVSDSHYMY